MASIASNRREPAPDSAPGPGAESTPISRHLVALSSAIRIRMREGLETRGHHLSASVTHLVPNLPAEGLGMSALATRVGLSIQRTGQLVQQLEDDGYVMRVQDEHDGRARRVVYTRRGRKLLRDIDALMQETTRLFEEILGADRLDTLRGDLERVDAAINGPDEALHVVVGE